MKAIQQTTNDKRVKKKCNRISTNTTNSPLKKPITEPWISFHPSAEICWTWMITSSLLSAHTILLFKLCFISTSIYKRSHSSRHHSFTHMTARGKGGRPSLLTLQHKGENGLPLLTLYKLCSCAPKWIDASFPLRQSLSEHRTCPLDSSQSWLQHSFNQLIMRNY